MTNNNTSIQASALLDAHVAFILNELTSDNLEALLASNLDYLLDQAKRVKLEDVVTPAMIEATAHKYAITMELGPGIPELVSKISRAIYHHPWHEQALIKDLIDEGTFRDTIDKALDMPKLREKIIHEAVSNPIYTDLISDVLYHGIRGFITDNPLTKRIPGAKSMMKLGKSVIDKATPNIEEVVLQYIRKNISASLKQSETFLSRSLTKEKLAEVITDTWDSLKNQPISTFQQYISEEDVEDYFVIGYEFWKEFRKTEYYRSLIDAGVTLFFEQYGDATLSHILSELGIDRNMLLDDLLHYVPHVTQALNEKGILAELLRQNLEPFYQSDSVREILQP